VFGVFYPGQSYFGQARTLGGTIPAEYVMNLHTTTTLGLLSDRSTRGMTTTYTTRSLMTDRSTEAG
jgi:hypothetical protein